QLKQSIDRIVSYVDTEKPIVFYNSNESTGLQCNLKQMWHGKCFGMLHCIQYIADNHTKTIATIWTGSNRYYQDPAQEKISLYFRPLNDDIAWVIYKSLVV